MPSRDPPSYVRYIDEHTVHVEVRDATHERLLASLGGRREPCRTYTLSFQDDAELARLLSALRDGGIAFLHVPHGWPPAAVYEKLREDGLLQGPYWTVTFTGGGPRVCRSDPP